MHSIHSVKEHSISRLSVAKTVDWNQSQSSFSRIGAVSYLNTKPLIWDLGRTLGDDGELSVALPSRLADDLAESRIDVGLIPVVEYFRTPGAQVVSNAAIACKGPVWSVRIFFRKDPKDVKVLALDEGSRTSAALCKVLFQHRFGFVPNTIPLPIHADPITMDADAVLVIGDRAMHPESYHPHFQCDWDLGQAWLEETGLPFVFAMWVCRDKSFATDALKTLLETTRDAGVKNVCTIAIDNASSYRLTVEQCHDYLTNYIRFYLGVEELAGLNEFRRRCVELSLIPS